MSMARNLMRRAVAAAGGGVTGCTWDPAAKGADITLSNGNKTALREGGSVAEWDHVKGTIGKSSGKIYFEVLIDFEGISESGVEGMLGIVDADNPVSTYHTLTNYGYGYGQLDGKFYQASGGTAFGATYGTGDIIMVAVDMDANLIWIGKNGTWQSAGDPAGGTNGKAMQAAVTYFPAFSGYESTSSTQDPQVTSKFDGAELTYAAPSGFTAGWGN